MTNNFIQTVASNIQQSRGHAMMEKISQETLLLGHFQ